MPPAPAWGGIAGAVFSALAVGIILTGLAPLLPLNLERAGIGSTWIGLMGATPSIAVIVTSALIPLIIRRIGAAQSMTASIGLAVAALLLFPFLPVGPWWFALRFTMALGIGTSLVVSQTWAIALSTPQRRGTVIGLYGTAITLGMAIGPLLVGWAGSAGGTPFYSFAVVMAVSILAVPLASRNGAPSLRDHATMRLRDAFRRAPGIMSTMLLIGSIWLIVVPLLPAYAVASGLTEKDAVFLITCFTGGNVVFQYPIGRLLDRWDAKRFLVICSVVNVLGPIAVALVIDRDVVLWLLLALWGGFHGGSYAANLNLIGQAFKTDDLSGANAALSLALEVGGLAGPLLAGFSMQLWGFQTMIAILIAVGLCLTWITVRPWRELSDAELTR